MREKDAGIYLRMPRSICENTYVQHTRCRQQSSGSIFASRDSACPVLHTPTHDEPLIRGNDDVGLSPASESETPACVWNTCAAVLVHVYEKFAPRCLQPIYIYIYRCIILIFPGFILDCLRSSIRRVKGGIAASYIFSVPNFSADFACCLYIPLVSCYFSVTLRCWCHLARKVLVWLCLRRGESFWMR